MMYGNSSCKNFFIEFGLPFHDSEYGPQIIIFNDFGTVMKISEKNTTDSWEENTYRL